jgi:hypothetical protein
MSPLNTSVSGNPSGTARIAILGDEMVVNVDMDGVPARITHLQHIHAGSACPTAADDTNGDGFVDVVEGIPRYGAILVPLDGNLESQAGGRSTSPSADGDGSYNYLRRGSFSRFLADLQAPDENPADAVIKLQPGEALNLAGRHVIIHGVPADSNLPETVQTIEGAPAHATLPIACGVIERASGDIGGTIGGGTTGETTGGTGGTTGGTTGDTGGTTGGTTGETTGGTGGTTGA